MKLINSNLLIILMLAFTLPSYSKECLDMFATESHFLFTVLNEQQEVDSKFIFQVLNDPSDAKAGQNPKSELSSASQDKASEYIFEVINDVAEAKKIQFSSETSYDIPAAKRSEFASYMASLRTIDTESLSKEEVFRLGRIVRDKSSGYLQARERLINAHLGFAMSMGLAVYNKLKQNYNSLEIMDFIQAANEGLVIAVDKYDPDKGAMLATYASFKIKESISHTYQHESAIVRFPVRNYNGIKPLTLALNKFLINDGKNPTDQQLASELGWTENKVKDIRAYLRLNQIASIEQSEMHSGGLRFEDGFIENGESIHAKVPTPEAELAKEQSIRVAKQALEGLTEGQRESVILRYGLDGNAEMSLREIGERRGVSPQRVDQLIKRSTKKLKEELSEAL